MMLMMDAGVVAVGEFGGEEGGGWGVGLVGAGWGVGGFWACGGFVGGGWRGDVGGEEEGPGRKGGGLIVRGVGCATRWGICGDGFDEWCCRGR